MRRWTNGLTAITLLAMIVIGAANVIRVERSDGGEVTVVEGSATQVVQPDGPLTIEAAWLTADARARSWSAAPTLIFASLQADWPLDPQEPGPAALPPGGWARFAFMDSADDRVLSVVIERYSGEIVTAESQSWDAIQTTGLPISATAITSETAVIIAESGYGQAWRLQCPIQRHETDVTLLAGNSSVAPETGQAVETSAATPTTAMIAASSPIASSGTPDSGFLTTGPVSPTETPATGDTTGTRWLVTYRDGIQPGINSVEMEIDAATGQILFIDDRSQGCSDLAG